MVLPALSGRLPISSAAAIAAPDEMPPGMPSLRARAREVAIAVALVDRDDLVDHERSECRE